MALCVLTYNFEGDTGTLPQLRLLLSILASGLLRKLTAESVKVSLTPALRRQPPAQQQASEKRQGTKSREVGHPTGAERTMGI